MRQQDLFPEEPKRSEKRNTNCWDCKNFYITWNPKTPYGCNLYKKETRQPPWGGNTIFPNCTKFEKKLPE